MSDRPHFMQLEPDEDATSVRDRLSFIRGQRVLLVWPEQGTVLTRKLDLVLIQREAMRRAIRLAIVTHDSEVIKNAAELNISTFETIGESERKRWKRGRSKVFTNRYQKPESEPDPTELQAVASRVKNAEESAETQKTLQRTLILAMLIGLILLFLYVVVPSATITLTPAQAVIEITTSITASPDIDDVEVEQGIIPTTRLRVETIQTGTIETTGEIPLEDTTAVGSVVFINRTEQAIEIPVGTAVRTSAGTPIQFRTLEAVTVPAGIGLQSEVPIEALVDFSGPIGNVDAELINTVIGPLAGQIDVINPTATSGGSSRTTRAVSEADRERLESIVRQQIQTQAYTEMQPLISATQFIILETIAISEERDDWKTFSVEVGSPAESLTLTMRAVVEAIAVDEQFGRQIAFANLSQQVPRGREIRPESINYVRGAMSALNPDQSVVFDMTVSAVVVEPVEVREVRNTLARKSRSAALTYLLNEIDIQAETTPLVRISPTWMRHMPILPTRITVNLLEPESTR